MASNYNQYEKTIWVNNQTKVNQTNMNKMEEGIESNRDNTINLKVILDDFITAFGEKLSLTFSENTLTLSIGDTNTPSVNRVLTTTIDTSSADVDEIKNFVSQIANTYPIYNNILRYVQVQDSTQLTSEGTITPEVGYCLYPMISVEHFKQLNSAPQELYCNNNTSGTDTPIYSIAFYNSSSSRISVVAQPSEFPVAIPEGTKYISVCLYNSAKDKVEVSLTSTILSDYNMYRIKENLFGTVETKAHKVTSFGATPNDENYPSEKLVKDSLDLKADVTDLIGLASETYVNQALASQWTVQLVSELPEASASTLRTYYLIPESNDQDNPDSYAEYITVATTVDNETVYNWERLGFAGAIDLATLTANFETALSGKISTSTKGIPGGVATLDSTGKVPGSQLPTPDHSSLQTKANLRTSWQSEPDDTHYPSEKLVADSLELKADKTDLTGYATENYVNQAVAGIYSVEIVTTLPTASASTMRKYYLVKDTTEGQDLYSEYITIAITGSNNQTTYSWERLGYAGATNLSSLIQRISNLEDGLEDLGTVKLDKTSVGIAGGAASLDSSGKVPDSQIDLKVIEGYYYNSSFYSDSAHTTLIAGVAGKLYIDLSQNTVYRYTGSAYQQISSVEMSTITLNENTVVFSKDIYAYTNIGKVTASNTNPVKIASTGDSLGTALTAILGEQQDVNPTVTRYCGITVSQTTPTSFNGGEYGDAKSSENISITFIASNYGIAQYGVKTSNGRYYDVQGKTFYYPFKTLIADNNQQYTYNIKITGGDTNFVSNALATSGTIVYRDTTNNILYCTLATASDDNGRDEGKLILTYTLSATAASYSEITRLPALTARVEFNNAVYYNNNNAETITDFCTFLDNDAQNLSDYLSASYKTKASTAYKVAIGNFYIYQAATSSTIAPTIAIENTEVNVTDSDAFYVSYDAEDYLYVFHKYNNKKLQYFAANTWYDVPDVTVSQATTEITLSTGATNNYYIYKVGPFVSAATMQFRMVNAA